MVFLKIFVVATNLMAFLPTIYAFRIKKYYEAVLYLLTCIASLVYHIIYTFETVESGNVKGMVRYVDFVLSYCCVQSVIFLLLIKKSEIRHIMMLISTYIEMYCNYITMNSVGHLVTSLFIAFTISCLYNLYKRNKIFENETKLCNGK